MPEVKFTDARTFAVQLGIAGKRLPEKVLSQVQRKLMLQALRGVVLKTPVDTGRARGNWQVTSDAPARSVVETQDKTGQATLTNGVTQVAALKPYGRAFISNNVPYIGVLEYGLYPIPGEGPLRPRAFRFVTRKGKRVRQRMTQRQRAFESQRKVTSQGFSTQAPQGMVRITFEEMKVQVQALQAELLRIAAGGTR